MTCEKNDPSERRSTPRMPYPTATYYECETVNGVGTIQDISPDGMFIQTPLPLDVGDPIAIAFQFRHSHYPMNITGEIARRTPAGVGVRFRWT